LNILKRDIEEFNEDTELIYEETVAAPSEVINLLESMEKIQEYDVLNILSTVDVRLRKFDIPTSKKPNRTLSVWMIHLDGVIENIRLDSPGLYESSLQIEDSLTSSKINQFTTLLNMLRLEKSNPKIHYVYTPDK
jgi:hypothetical protein